VEAKSKGEVMRAVLRVNELLKSMGIEVGKPKVAVRNIVASADLRSQVDLIGLCERAKIPASKLIYEPKQFPLNSIQNGESTCNLRNI
jgi:TATA-box binding protein (TBP) (component of TFIID and TFIIIB)